MLMRKYLFLLDSILKKQQICVHKHIQYDMRMKPSNPSTAHM